jgi:gliding motility-associated-like protein
MLKALGKNGCNDSLSYSFRISDSSGVTLPNIFTPNDDGVNDVFRPITKGITSMMVWVYNRYGVTIANWDRINGSWDGYNTSGLQCGSGEYFVVVEATGFNGKTYKQKGTLTLIR